LETKKNCYFGSIHQIMILGHRITEEVTKRLKPFDLSEPQYNVLRILAEQEGNPITVFDIQQQMIQRSSNVTRIIDKLLKKGLVSRVVCQENRRKMDITITQKGIELLQTLAIEIKQIHEPRMALLSEEEALQLRDLLSKLHLES